MNRRRFTLTSAAAAAIALAAGGAITTSNAAESPTYVALGDSYSAGTGAGSPTDNDCYRSPHGYPHLIAESQGYALDYQACSGATTSDVLNHQVGALDGDTALVTITIGGNDLNFASVITNCALPAWLGDCFGKIEESRGILNTELPQRYDTVFGTIAAQAPDADVRVAGYPLLFNGQDCHVLTFFSAAEMAELNEATHELNAVTAQHTQAHGLTWVDPIDHFTGHAVCDADPWINNLSLRIVDSFHPNQPGNVGYAEVLWPGSTATLDIVGDAPDQSFALGSTSPEALTAEAALVLTMDLVSPENLRLAAEAGVDTDTLIALEAQLRTGDPQQIEEALDGLAELDAQVESAHAGQ